MRKQGNHHGQGRRRHIGLARDRSEEETAIQPEAADVSWAGLRLPLLPGSRYFCAGMVTSVKLNRASTKKKPGPPATGKGEQVVVRIQPDPVGRLMPGLLARENRVLHARGPFAGSSRNVSLPKVSSVPTSRSIARSLSRKSQSPRCLNLRGRVPKLRWPRWTRPWRKTIWSS